MRRENPKNPHGNRPTPKPKQVGISKISPATSSIERRVVAVSIGATIGATAIGLAAFGFVANASYVASFGQPGLSAVMLAGLGVAIEVLALGLPTLARLFAHGGDRRGARVAWVGWLLAVAMALISSCGFSSRH